MRLYLVHHGEAVPPGVDPQRPLSGGGSASVKQLAEKAAKQGAKPAVVWHSGKLRARQTAEAFWRACNALADVSAARGLQPDDPPDWIAEKLAGEASADDPRDIMLVGHMPHIQRLLGLLVAGTNDGTMTFPAHGFVALEPKGHGWVECWRLEG